MTTATIENKKEALLNCKKFEVTEVEALKAGNYRIKGTADSLNISSTVHFNDNDAGADFLKQLFHIRDVGYKVLLPGQKDLQFRKLTRTQKQSKNKDPETVLKIEAFCNVVPGYTLKSSGVSFASIKGLQDLFDAFDQTCKAVVSQSEIEDDGQTKLPLDADEEDAE